MAQYFPGLKSRNDAARLRAARDLQKYVSTELRELPDEQSSEILDDVNQNIFSLISSQEVHEKKGGILAIVSLVGLEGGGNVAKLGRYANYLRSILPHPDVALTEMTAKAIGQLALAEGTYTAEYVEFEVRRALEWIGGNEHKRLAAVLILRELAVHTPTLFYQQIQQFFDNIFTAIRDPKALIRERAVSALRACLRLTAQRETKEAVNNTRSYQRAYDEAINGLGEGSSSRDKIANLSRDDRIHGSLLIINELIMNSAWNDESLRPELSDPEENEDHNGLDILMEGEHKHSLVSGCDRGQRSNGTRPGCQRTPVNKGHFPCPQGVPYLEFVCLILKQAVSRQP
jgi:FKBP12-rapamycin complex-associated protein